MTTESEIDTLITSVLEKDILQFKKKHSNIFRITKKYLTSDKYMLYGGMAINYVLPKSSQFYTLQDMPDYDVFCKNAQKSAFELTDLLFKAGYKYAEAKPAMHYGTYKVYANFIPVVDFTEISITMYNHLFKDAVLAKGINMWCVPIHYLRMSMYLELSRPRGDITRWSKVYERLQLLNEAHPITKSPTLYDANNKAMDESLGIRKTHAYNTNMKPLLKKVLKKCIQKKYVFIGNTCLEILSNLKSKNGSYEMNLNSLYNKNIHGIHMNPKITYMDVLVNENLEKSVKRMKGFMESHTKEKVRTRRHNSITRGEFLPERYTLYIKNKAILCMYSTFGCHGYYTLKNNGMRVASIHTMLNIYFATLLTRNNLHIHSHIFHMIQHAMDLEKKKRFPIVHLGKCYGYQKTMFDLKKSFAIKKEIKKYRKMKVFRPRLKNKKKYAAKHLKSKLNTKTTKGLAQLMKNMNPFSKIF